MTTVIGMMCVRDEADLLPEVLDHLDGKLDKLYVYDDGSTDKTQKILREHHTVDYLMTKDADEERLEIARPNYHHLLERIKEDYKDKDVWVVITMGDRFFLNKTPREIVEGAGDFTAVEGVQLDFLRHRRDPWTEENDTFPKWPVSLRKLCRWVRCDERCIVAFKLTSECSYLKAKYPWPRGSGTPQYECRAMDEKISLDMPFLEHQGRRSPKAAMWRVESGSRKLGRKYQHYDLSTFESTVASMRRLYEAYRLYPWMGVETLDTIVAWENEERFHDRVNKRWFFKGVEAAWAGASLPERSDI
jgi:hypothetical protein